MNKWTATFLFPLHLGIALVYLLLMGLSLQAQPTLIWEDAEAKISKTLKNDALRLVHQMTDSAVTERKTSQLLQLLQSEGFLTASLTFDTLLDHAITIAPGVKYVWEALYLEAFPKRLLEQWRMEQAAYTGTLSEKDIAKLVGETLFFHENNGYPFARISFDSLEFLAQNRVKGTLFLQKGPFITIDSLVLKGYSKIPKSLLKKELGLAVGMPYNEKQLQQLPEKMAAVEHLQMARPPQVLFQDGKTTLFLYFEENKSNQFDGIVGINTRDDGRVTFNGDFNLRLLNTLKTGEDFSINWRSPDEAIQQIQLDLNLPYLFGLPFLIDFNFNLFRQDSSWSNRNIQAGLGYVIATGTTVSLGIQNQSSTVLSTNTNTNTGSVSLRSFYTQARLNKVNHPLLPTKGYRIDAKIFQGNRWVADERLNLVGIDMKLQYFWQLSTRSHLYAKGMLQSLRTESLFTNELYRLGGLKTLRGFNELSLFGSTATLGTLEYRLFLERFSYLFAFVDGGFIENAVENTNETPNAILYPIGTGAGFSFRTGGGIFTLAFAIGRTNVSNFDFRTSKVHVGFVNRF